MERSALYLTAGLLGQCCHTLVQLPCLLRLIGLNAGYSFIFHVTEHADGLAITAHWIDANFHTHEILLGFELLEGRHTGEHLAAYVYEIAEEFQMKSKLFCVTTDNASNNYSLTSSLRTRLAENDPPVIFDPSEQHSPCVAHVLNLAVKTFLSNLKVIDESALSDEEQLDLSSIDPEKDFAVTMKKIRIITKVQFLLRENMHYRRSITRFSRNKTDMCHRRSVAAVNAVRSSNFIVVSNNCRS